MKHEHFYEIAMNDGTPLEVPRIKKLPLAGDILIVAKTFHTPGDQVYEIGDEVHLMKRTWDAPHGKVSSLGNWLAISKFGPSVWSNIEWAMAEGTFKVRETPKVRRARK
jgi:hypothetical protein